MNEATHEVLSFTPEEWEIMGQIVRKEQNKLLIEIRHTDHRAFREELRHRLQIVECLADRLAQ